MDDAARLEVAIVAARQGGRLALARLGQPLYFTLKGAATCSSAPRSPSRTPSATSRLLRAALPERGAPRADG